MTFKNKSDTMNYHRIYKVVIMLKKLIQRGTSCGVVIPKSTLEFLNINPVIDKVEILWNENEIIIRKNKK